MLLFLETESCEVTGTVRAITIEEDKGTKIEQLASYQRGLERINARWPMFIAKRETRLEQPLRHGTAAERVAENIIEDLFTGVLDWALGDLNNQVGYANIVFTKLGIKYVLIEAKKPRALAWNRKAAERALDQALRYVSEQKVRSIAVSVGAMLYAAELLPSKSAGEGMLPAVAEDGLFHPKYRVPSDCFAYVRTRLIREHGSCLIGLPPAILM